ncbi:MAG: DinB family protein [Dehalococcoidia bacterium]
MADLIDDFYRQNAWANLRLIDVCRGLTDEQLDATAPGAYGSVRSTLAHLVGAEALNLRRLGGAGPEIASRGAAWPGFQALEDVVRRTADGLIERAHSVGGSRIVVEESGARFEVDANVLLMQVINHSTEHRSQICTILTVLGALPSTGDDGQTIVDAWAWSDVYRPARRLP